MKNKFLHGKFSTAIYYIAIFLFLIAFNFQDTPPPSGWYQQFLPNLGGRSISDIFFLDSLTGWAVTPYVTQNDTAYVIKTTNGGDNWFISNMRIGQYVGHNNIKFLNSNTGFICGTSQSSGYAGLSKSTDGGYNWISLNVPDQFLEYNNMSVLNKDTIWLVALSSLTGGVFRTTNGGLSWDQQFAAGTENPNKIYMYNSRIGFICNNMNNTGIKKTTNGGLNWVTVLSNEGFRDMYFTDSLVGWKSTGLPDSSMKKTIDGGLNWIKQSLPQGGYISNLGGILRFSNINRDTVWGVGNYLIYPNNSVHPIFYRTTNGGTNWYYQIPDTSLVHLVQSYYYTKFFNKNFGWGYNFNNGIHTVTGGDTTFLSSIHQINNIVTKEFKLFQNYPNPFNPKTVIGYSLLKNGYVKIIVYDITGREVAIPVNENKKSGNYETQFSINQYSNNISSSGIYFYSLFVDRARIDTKKMIFLK